MYILSCIFAVLCSAILPITLTVILCAHYKGIWKPILFGALTFTVFQVLITCLGADTKNFTHLININHVGIIFEHEAVGVLTG